MIVRVYNDRFIQSVGFGQDSEEELKIMLSCVESFLGSLCHITLRKGSNSSR